MGEIIMAVMYLAKLNVNAKIFDVYDDKLKISEVLSQVYDNLNDTKIYEEENIKEYTDELGNKAFYVKKSKYQFD